MEHEVILKMIEEVDPADTAKLDEIDARVWCFISKIGYLGKIAYKPRLKQGGIINDYRYLSIFPCLTDWEAFVFNTKDHIMIPGGEDYIASQEHNQIYPPKYTRSRDALKAIRPEGMFLRIETDGSVLGYPDPNPHDVIFTTCINTEELAELHCIIQAIAHERSNVPSV